MTCGNHTTGLVFLNMAEGRMIQMIPEHPETPLLQQKGRAGFCIFIGRTCNYALMAMIKKQPLLIL